MVHISLSCMQLFENISSPTSSYLIWSYPRPVRGPLSTPITGFLPGWKLSLEIYQFPIMVRTDVEYYQDLLKNNSSDMGFSVCESDRVSKCHGHSDGRPFTFLLTLRSIFRCVHEVENSCLFSLNIQLLGLSQDGNFCWKFFSFQ